jgi:DUF1365 family protein
VESRLYTGTITHERRVPKKNRFRYQVYYVFVDVDELDTLDDRLNRFAHNRPGLVSLWDKDHGPRDGSPLRPWIDAVCAEHGIDISGGRVYLLTFPRVLGAKFYPIAIWYCYDSAEVCRAVLLEVQNTFGEHHNYLLHNDGAPFDWHMKSKKDKGFHVSPFIVDTEAHYEFRLTEPGDRLRVTIHDFVQGPLLLVAVLELAARPLTDRELTRTVMRLGPMSVRALLLIHYQAARIFAKGIRYVPKPEPPRKETT